jgi:hypothetical protein
VGERRVFWRCVEKITFHLFGMSRRLSSGGDVLRPLGGGESASNAVSMSSASRCVFLWAAGRPHFIPLTPRSVLRVLAPSHDSRLRAGARAASPSAPPCRPGLPRPPPQPQPRRRPRSSPRCTRPSSSSRRRMCVLGETEKLEGAPSGNGALRGRRRGRGPRSRARRRAECLLCACGAARRCRRRARTH